MTKDSNGPGPGSGPKPKSGSGSKSYSKYERFGDRQVFTVGLVPGETTIVSWKKLLRDAAAAEASSGGPAPAEPGPNLDASATPAPPPTESSSKKQPENDVRDLQAQSGSNRLSTVIERIERMYAGNGSSDEEDVVLDDVPDDDEYDTEDSFIDDAELDEYFQVDNSKIKHDGFFVNRGMLERIEPTPVQNQQPKKRRRKDLATDNVGSDGQNISKHSKTGNKHKEALLSTERNSISMSGVAVPNIPGKDMKLQGEAPEKKKILAAKTTVDASELLQTDDIRQKKDTGDADKLKKIRAQMLNDTSVPSSIDKSSSLSKAQSGLPEQIAHEKVPIAQRKEGSSVRPKSSPLDKAIRELEKTVAETRPPSAEVQDADNSSQGVKRRLSPEIKQKLAKVARVAQASHGKIPKDLIHRLMSIVGHLMQLRTLKRNLNIMANMGLSAKQEKDVRMQQIKQEILDMINARAQLVKPRSLGQQTANSDDFQEPGPQEKEDLKRKYSMDAALEDKICDLYNLYAERLEEDSGPPVKRMYEELAALWPSGVVDTQRIKRAIYRAKGRRGALGSQQKDQEKMKKMLTPKTPVDSSVQGTAGNNGKPLHMQEKLVTNFRDHGSTSVNMRVPDSNNDTSLRVPVTFVNGPIGDKLKQQKLKGNSSNHTEANITDMLPKKKVKKKPEADMIESQFHLEKPTPKQTDGKIKLQKQMAAAPSKSNLQPAAPPAVNS